MDHDILKKLHAAVQARHEPKDFPSKSQSDYFDLNSRNKEPSVIGRGAAAKMEEAIIALPCKKYWS
jgi:hypothetical protein